MTKSGMLMDRAFAEWRENWRIVICAMIGLTASTSYVFSLGVLVPHIHSETGWSRAEISSGLLVGALTLALVSPITGRLIDRGYTRACAMCGFTIYGLGLVCIGTLRVSIGAWLLIWVAAAVGAGACSLTVWTTLINRRFTAARGITLAIVMSGSGLSALVAPLLAGALAATLGWRQAYAILGLGTIALCLPLFAVWLHDAPVAVPAGERRPEQGTKGPPIFTVALLKLSALALILTGTLTGISVHFPLIIGQAGVPAARAAQLTGVIGLGVIAGRFIIGAVLDRLSGATVGAVAMLAPLAAIWLLFDANAGQSVGGAIAATLIGLAVGSVSMVLAVITGQLYRADNFGSAWGVVIACMSTASGIGPVIAGKVFDRFGNYSTFLVGAAVVFTAAIVMFLSLSRPLRTSRSQGFA